ncbi:MAG: rRNA pseudouridine synthase [Oscillospiraceae bacterium]|nr:rRNA pseudouridine synthase [Oscillospiraceae bacterium]
MALKRLDKLLADMGIASRSELKQIIKSGRVTVDGRAVTVPDAKFDSESCDIALDGKSLTVQKFRYYMMDKPAGVLSVTEDRKQKTVLDLLPQEQQRMGLFPVGRLDKDTSGLLLLTNDGDFAHRVISPKSGVEKLYLAVVDGEPNEADVQAFREGIVLKDGTECLPAKLELLGNSCCLVTVMEGKYHQVKRMLASRGKPVLELRRLAVGELEVGENLGPGGFVELDEKDLCKVIKDFVMEK